MTQFRKKPVVIEAWKVSELLCCARESCSKLPEPIRAIYETGGVVFTPQAIFIETLEGKMMGAHEDWIIRGVKGEFYPCKPDIFEATYDPVGS